MSDKRVNWTSSQPDASLYRETTDMDCVGYHCLFTCQLSRVLTVEDGQAELTWVAGKKPTQFICLQLAIPILTGSTAERPH